MKKNPNHVNASRDDAKNSMATCPLMKSTMQLVPLCYGLVDDPALDPSAEIPVPYTLATRPLGIRLMRDGWLYVIDAKKRELSEYRVLDGVVTAMLWQGTDVHSDHRETPINKPVLIYPARAELHVCHSEIQWTAKKCRQVLYSPSERDYFMQPVDLGQANCETGGPGLLTPDQAERWLAEVACSGDDDSDPDPERTPYLWETFVRFHDVPMRHLSDCIEAEYRYDVMYLPVRDDIGVLRDLANYQDKVVGWIDAWANGGSQARGNERDYLLACYIESLTQLTQADIGGLADASNHPAIKRMLGDLEAMPAPQQGTTRQALVDYLNRGGLPTPPKGSPVPPELARLHKEALEDALYMVRYQGASADYAAATHDIEDTDRRYYTREHFKTSPQDFVEEHFEALIKLGKEQDRRIRDVLNGAKMGQRGINDLIDREAMDNALFAHRQSLQRWNTLLEHITADRTALFCAGFFHKSAWYYDPEDARQIGQCFTTEYACLKDICRSDDACERVLQYLEQAPHFSRPQFYTRPYSEHTTARAQYAFVPAAGMTLFNNMPELLKKLQDLENNRLPALDRLPDDTRAVAEAAQQTMTPALNRGMEKALADFDQVFKGQAMPTLDQLFSRLPKALLMRILDAAKHEGVTFTFASADEKDSLRRELRDWFREQEYLQRLKRERVWTKQTAGHKSPRARELQVEIANTRYRLGIAEARLANALSPIGDLPDNHVQFFGATPARAGITVVFPPAGRQEIAGLMRNFREGVKAAPLPNRLGDGAALLVFVVQALNLWQVMFETISRANNKRELLPAFSAAVATGAAGFAAAQGIFDTALTARSSVLARGLQNHAIDYVHVQMGKLHIGLGTMTYVFGLVAAGSSLNSYQANWEQAVRSGNGGAQAGVIMSMAGSGGLLASNLYGLGHTLDATATVFLAKQGAARTAAWAAAGARLSSVFFRVNLVGALFTALELGGNYLYNHYNTSAHDQWLQSTPWGRDASKRKSLNLADYQNALITIMQAPSVQVGPVEYDTWWKDLLLEAKVGDMHLLLPGLDIGAFTPPMGGRPSHQLSIAAYRISTIRVERGMPHERWEILSEAVEARLRRVDGHQMILCIGYPVPDELIPNRSREELMLVVVIQSPNANGQPHQRTYSIRFEPRGSGAFPPVDQKPLLPNAPLLQIEPLMLELISHD